MLGVIANNPFEETTFWYTMKVINPKGNIMPNDSSKVIPVDALNVAIGAFSEILGTSGVLSVVRHAKINISFENGKVIKDKNPTFGDVGQVTEAFFDIYGSKGAAAILKRTGRVLFQKWHEAYPTALNTVGTALKVMSPAARIKTVLNVVKLAAKHIGHVETDVREENGLVYFAAFQCPFCAGTHGEETICFAATGAIEAVSKWATGETWKVNEISCMSMGKQACVFRISPPR